MTSHKGQARAKRVREFKASLACNDDVFAREEHRHRRTSDAKDAALREKACAKKKRYPSRYDAELAIEACEEHVASGLRCYECPYCRGWHLTSKPER